jgi:hypothetical protein
LKKRSKRKVEENKTWWSVEYLVVGYMRAPKFLVRPKEGPTMSNCGSRWNLVPLLASSTKWGERGVLKAPGLY